MPNWVQCKIEAEPEVLSAMVRTATEQEYAEHELSEIERKARLEERGAGDKYVYEPIDMEEKFVDFELIVPQPENIETGGCNGSHEENVICWYQWNIENWGTKWNATRTSYDENAGSILFETAWSFPAPVIYELSKKFPDHVLHVQFADEDLGYNVGEAWIQDGEAVEVNESIQYGSDEACELAAQLHYGRPYVELRAEWDAEEAEVAEAVEEKPKALEAGNDCE